MLACSYREMEQVVRYLLMGSYTHMANAKDLAAQFVQATCHKHSTLVSQISKNAIRSSEWILNGRKAM